MTEPGVAPPAAPATAPGAGALLRAAREKQGLHIGALAAALKVPQRKLEALEHDRWHELPDTAFARALAQSMCRVLKVDPAPVLALMPQGGAASLEPVSSGLNMPFRDRSGRGEPLPVLLARRPLVWAGGVLLLAAVLLWWVPADWWRSAAPPAPAASAPEAFEPAVPEPAASAVPADDAAAAASQPPEAPAGLVASPAPAPAPAAAAGGALVVRAKAASWVEVVDAAGATLVSRTLSAGESLELDGALPLQVRIGNAAATELSFRGRPVDLAAATRDNTARLELP